MQEKISEIFAFDNITHKIFVGKTMLFFIESIKLKIKFYF